MSDRVRLAGVELGGTKCIALLSDGEEVVHRHVMPTGEPGPTLAALNEILRGWADEAPFAALGIASFGPLQLDPERSNFGTMLTTPKPGWEGARISDELGEGLECPRAIDTDVNAAALAEFQWGAAKGCSSVCYITVGTGVGGGLLVDGSPVHGAMHPEIGHLRLRRAPGDVFAGVCIFHSDCIEGLVSGPAISARFRRSSSNVPDEDPRWQHIAHDLGELAAAIVLAYSPHRILFGGTVSLARPFLLPHIRKHVVSRLESYLPLMSEVSVNDQIVLAGLGAEAGPLGAIALAGLAAGQTRRAGR